MENSWDRNKRLSMEEGLAAMAVSGSKPAMTYGNGNSNTVKHYYGGTKKTKKKGK